MSIATKIRQTERTRVNSGQSVRVNLLPQATRDGAKASRQKAMAGALVGVVVLGLAGTTYWQRGQLSNVEAELVAAQSERTAAQQQVDELAPFASLESQLTEAHLVVASALGGQSTLAGVLQDVAMVMPEDSSVLTLEVDLTPTLDEEGLITDFGVLRATGETLDHFAPGVELMLLQLDKAAGFGEAYLTTAAVDEFDIVTFDLDLQLGGEHLTYRYINGIPEVLR